VKKRASNVVQQNAGVKQGKEKNESALTQRQGERGRANSTQKKSSPRITTPKRDVPQNRETEKKETQGSEKARRRGRFMRH